VERWRGVCVFVVSARRLISLSFLHTKHTDEKSLKTEDISIPQKILGSKVKKSLNPQKPSLDEIFF
jgi:hypothetical protein